MYFSELDDVRMFAVPHEDLDLLVRISLLRINNLSFHKATTVNQHQPTQHLFS